MAIDIADYIRQAALARGIDPNVALRVAKGEGGLRDPFRHGEGPAPKTQAPQFGSTENSYGPFQLYISGNGAGLGDQALAAGIDPRKNWKAGVDFALDEARKTGWGPWYGAKAQGITGMMGIDGHAAPPLPAPVTIADHPVASVSPVDPSTTAATGSQDASPGGISQDVASYYNSLDKRGGHKETPLQSLGRALMQTPNAPRVRMQPLGATNGNALLKYMQNPTRLADMLLKKRLMG